MKRMIFALCAAGMMAVSASAADPYKVTVPLSEDEDGAMVYLRNADTGEKLDSIIVENKVAVFSGEIDEAIPAAIAFDGRNRAQFVLEPGSMVVDVNTHSARGSMLNDVLNEYISKTIELSKRYRACETDAERDAVEEEFIKLANETMEQNMDNPIGYMIFVDEASGMDVEEFNGYLAKYPSLANYSGVKRYKEINDKKAMTSVGKMFADFEIVNDGKVEKLSDYVGKGKYVLVDFWASWCGPCLRQIPVIKELLAEFGDKGLEVLGVAVWDEPENTIKAIESHGITWPCIINAQRIPTDIYGIAGIPCIILYGPDGKILSRDKQSEALKADVRAAFDGSLKID